MRALALALSLMACEIHVSEVPRPGVERIHLNPGGFVGPGMRAWRDRKARLGTERYVIDGRCDSLCAHLVLQEVFCFTDRAVLWMHPALIMGVVETPATRRWTEWSVSRWPRSLREWWAEHQPGAAGRTLTYQDLQEIVPALECRDAER